MQDIKYVTEQEAYQRSWKSKSAWKRTGGGVPKDAEPIAVVYRKTEKSHGLSFAGQPFIQHLGDDVYLLPADDDWKEVCDPKTGSTITTWVCNSWEVFSQEQFLPNAIKVSDIGSQAAGNNSTAICAEPKAPPRSTRKPRRRPQSEVSAYGPERHPPPETITIKETPFAQWFLSHLLIRLGFVSRRFPDYVPQTTSSISISLPERN